MARGSNPGNAAARGTARGVGFWDGLGHARQMVTRALTLDVHVGMTLDEVERVLIEATLALYPHKPKAASILGVSLKTLYNKIHRYMEEALVERIVDRDRRERLEGR